MKSWLCNLQKREQYFLLLAGIFFTIFGLYSFILKPMYSQIYSYEQKLKNNQELLTWMAPKVELLKQIQDKSRPDRKLVSAETILPTIDNLLDSEPAFSKVKKQLSQGQDGIVLLTMKEVPFDIFINCSYLVE